MNIQTILDKLTDDLTHYTEVINTIPAYQGIQEFDKVWNGVKDSLTSMLDELTDKLPYYSSDGDTEWANGYNQYRDEVINIINSHR